MAETIPLPAVLPPNTNAGTALARLAWVLFGISTALVGARLYSKVFRVKRFARDDVLMLIAYVRQSTSRMLLRALKLTTSPGLRSGILRLRPACLSKRIWSALRVPHTSGRPGAPQVDIHRAGLLSLWPNVRSGSSWLLPSRHRWKVATCDEVLAVGLHCYTGRHEHRTTYYPVLRMWYRYSKDWKVCSSLASQDTRP